MGKITEELLSLVRRQVDDHGIVVWYDPEGHYRDVVDRLSNGGKTTISKYENSFLQLRHAIEPFLECLEDSGKFSDTAGIPPRMIVYVPRNHTDSRNALIEVESAGVVMEPGAHPWQRIAPDQATEIGKKVDQGLLSLEDLDRMAEQTGELGTVQLIFGTTAVVDVTLKFLTSEDRDEQIIEKNAIPELIGLYSSELGIELDDGEDLATMRNNLCQKLLLTELEVSARRAGNKVSELIHSRLPRLKRHQDQVCRLCDNWRNRSDLKQAYVAAAKTVESETAVDSFKIPGEALRELETFPFIESRLLQEAGRLLSKGSYSKALQLAEKRKNSFWTVEEPANQLKWTLFETSARLFDAASKFGFSLKDAPSTPDGAVQCYAKGASGKDPWFLIDTYHRHLERLYASFELSLEEDRAIEKVIDASRRSYTHAVRLMSEYFIKTLVEADWHFDDTCLQTEIFANHVRPEIGKYKVAYFLVDSLRFELGMELMKGLGDDFETELFPAAAQLPGITPVGMAALLPGAEKGIGLVEKGKSSFDVSIGKVILRDRTARIAHLRNKVDHSLIELKLNDLMKPKKKLREEILTAEFAVVTSQEIDRLGEKSETEEEVRRYIDEVLQKLRLGIRRLASLGYQRFFLTSDHGHLFGQEIDSGLKMDPPGGRKFGLHRRVWIGRGGKAGPGYLRVKAGEIGLEGNFDLAFPSSLGCFKSPGGGRSYFHGGLSLQEMIIPVLKLKAKPESAVAGTSESKISIQMEKAKVTNRLFTVLLTYEGGDLFAAEEKRVRVEVRSGKRLVGNAATAGYGFEDGTTEIQLRRKDPNTVTLLITEEAGLKQLSVHVLDAESRVELVSLMNLEVDIA